MHNKHIIPLRGLSADDSEAFVISGPCRLMMLISAKYQNSWHMNTSNWKSHRSKGSKETLWGSEKYLNRHRSLVDLDCKGRAISISLISVYVGCPMVDTTAK